MTNLNRLEMKTEDDIQKIPQMGLSEHVEEDIFALVERLNDFLSQDGYEVIFPDPWLAIFGRYSIIRLT